MRKPVFLFLFGIIYFFTNCENSKAIARDPGNNFEVLYVSEYGGSGMEEVQIIDNQEEFAQFWTQVTFESIEDVPQINFSEKTVILKHLPSRNSGGSTYDVESVYYDGAEVTVRYTVSSPADFGTTAITSPLMILAVEKIEDPNIEFKNSNKN